MAKQKIRMDIYDEDGIKCETIISKMDADEVRAHMVEALQNDGIPVLREVVSKGKESEHDCSGKLSTTLEAGDVKFGAFGDAADVLDALREVLDALEVIDDE